MSRSNIVNGPRGYVRIFSLLGLHDKIFRWKKKFSTGLLQNNSFDVWVICRHCVWKEKEMILFFSVILSNKFYWLIDKWNRNNLNCCVYWGSWKENCFAQEIMKLCQMQLFQCETIFCLINWVFLFQPAERCWLG